jgi:hypothetical protein
VQDKRSRGRSQALFCSCKTVSVFCFLFVPPLKAPSRIGFLFSHKHYVPALTVVCSNLTVSHDGNIQLKTSETKQMSNPILVLQPLARGPLLLGRRLFQRPLGPVHQLQLPVVPPSNQPDHVQVISLYSGVQFCVWLKLVQMQVQ